MITSVRLLWLIVLPLGDGGKSKATSSQIPQNYVVEFTIYVCAPRDRINKSNVRKEKNAHCTAVPISRQLV